MLYCIEICILNTSSLIHISNAVPNFSIYRMSILVLALVPTVSYIYL